MKNALVIFLILISQNSLVAQSKIDSLLHKLETSKKDTARINILNAIGFQFQNDNIDSANHYYYKANKLAKEINNKLKESQTLKHIGYCKSLTGDYEGARLKYKQALKLIESKEPDRDILKLRAALYTNIGSSYTEQSNYKEALKYFFKALRINEPMKNEAGIANDYGNLGIVYIELSEFGKALDYLEKALKINKKLNLKNQIIVNLSNIANVHAWQQNHKLALEYYSEVIKLSDESGDKRTKAANLGNIGTVYQEQGNYDEALKYYFQAISIFEELGNNYGQAVFLGNVGSIYISNGKNIEGEKYLLKAIEISDKSGFTSLVRNIEQLLSDHYERNGNYQLAYEHYKNYILMRDSIDNDENKKQQLQAEAQYEYDKKSAIDSIAHKKELEVKNAELAKQDAEIEAKRKGQLFLYSGLALVILFAGFMYNRFKITQKQKGIIEDQKSVVEQQKQIVEEAHKEIKDSILYAERLQRSLMASDNLLKKQLKDYFIYFNPKEKVSGDFYWAAELKNGNFLLACADSTGHGVPGAIMSMMNMNSLKESVKEGFIRPDEILNHTRKIIIETLANDGSEEGGKDGMDCSLISFDFKKMKLQFSLANNPVWIIRPSVVSDTKFEIKEFKADKMPVGKHDKQYTPFTLHEITLQKGDMIYTFTDGYADQFGGEKGKKFKYANLQKLLVENSNLELETLNFKLQTVFNEWKAWPNPEGGVRELEQVDDVCIIGIRI